MAFSIGDQQITREQMPSFGMTQLNPNHIEQMFQDVVQRNLPPVYQGMQTQMPQMPEEMAAGAAGGMQ